MSNNNSTSFIKTLGDDVSECIKTKWIGCFVALAAAVLSIVQAIVYSFVGEQDFSSGALTFSILAAVLFFVLSLFKRTSSLAPIFLMIFDFLALLTFAAGMIDFFSTAFFDGFSFGKFFKLETPYWLSSLLFILSAVISCVTVYLPQNRKIKVEEVKNDEEN